MNKLYISWEQVFERLKQFDYQGAIIYGVPKGGMIATSFLKHARTTHIVSEANLILDDLVDSGATRQWYLKTWPIIPFRGLFDKSEEVIDDWIVFPWERDHPNGEETIEQNIVRSLQYIGEDVNREGLIDTPRRIVKSWKEIYSGYNQNPSDLMTTFTNDKHDEIVLVKNIEMYSMCEHHMIPFFGKAHIAYIPDKKLIGLSKLARLIDLYSRRLQIQERIGDQVTNALMEYLAPKGAACIIEATHMCMRMRGVEKQNSVAVTSSMKGAFLDKPAARAELMQLIKE